MVLQVRWENAPGSPPVDEGDPPTLGGNVPEVVRQRHVAAGAQEVWTAISAVNAMLEWYPSARKVEKLEGPDEGVGRVQRVRYKIGSRNAIVDQEVTAWEPGRRLELRQLREFLGSKQAPLLAKDVRTAIEIEETDTSTSLSSDEEVVPGPAGRVDGGTGQDPASSGCGSCVIRVRSTWEPVGLKGQLATQTVIVPRAESLADTVLEAISGMCEHP